jgi:Ca2+-binding EF-hand superfamily protein
VDEDGSGLIEFDEFLGIIKKADKDEGTREITSFFKKLTSGEIGSKDISFSLFVQRQRRQHLMAAVIGEKGSTQKKKGRKIMENLKV